MRSVLKCRVLSSSPKAVWKKLVLQLKVGPAAVAGQVLIAGRPLGVGLCTSNGDWDIA
jgi:hypothetical protein